MATGFMARLLCGIKSDPAFLPQDFTTDDFGRFMRAETYRYSPRYAKKNVEIDPADSLLLLLKSTGVLLAFLHYGSFFLMGGALRHQLGINYTAIASRRNFKFLSTSEQKFWRGVHQRSGQLYGRPLFFSDDSIQETIAWLKQPGHALGVALDAHEIDQPQKRLEFTFRERTIFLPTAPARLARLAGVPIVPILIQFDASQRSHRLLIGPALSGIENPINTTQAALSILGPWVEHDPRQQFFDITAAFSKPL